MGEQQNVLGRFAHLSSGMAGPNIRADYDLINKVLAWLFPQWTRSENGLSIFYWDPTTMLVAWCQRMLEPNTWQRPSEKYDLVFVFNEASRQMAIDSGYPAAKLVVAGIPRLDATMARLNDGAFRRAIYRALGLDCDEPFIIWNIEPGWEHSYRSRDEHWRNILAQRDALRRVGWRVVVSLHPLCRLENYLFLEDTPGFVIAREYSIHEIYPFCSAVLTHTCSTNMFAETFGKQLVFIDYEGATRPTNPRAGFYRVRGAVYAYSSEELGGALLEATRRVSSAPATTRIPAMACEKILHEVERHFLADMDVPAHRPLQKLLEKP
jgi:hypothetical protein